MKIILFIIFSIILTYVFDDTKLKKMPYYISQGRMFEIDELLKRGVNVNTSNDMGVTALMLYAEKFDYEKVNILIKKGANPNIQDKDGRTALFYVLKPTWESFRLETMRNLIDGGADINISDNSGKTIYSILVNPDYYSKRIDNEYTEMLQYVLTLPNLKIDHSKIKESLYRPFIKNLPSGFRKVLLLQIEDDYEQDFSQVLLAAFEGFPGKMKELHNRGIDITQQCQKTQMTALEIASWRGKTLIAEYLLQCDADVNSVDFKGNNALLIACSAENEEIIQLLVSCGADVNSPNLFGTTAFGIAIDIGNQNIINYLIKNGADLNQKTYSEKTPLIIAASVKNLELVRFLVKKGVNINARDKNGNCALSLAIENKDREMIKCLLDFGADVNIRGFDNQSCLHLIIEKNLSDLLDEFLNKTTDLNESGYCMLIDSCRKGNLNIVKKLIDHGVDVNYGEIPPLGWTIQLNDLEITRLLIEKGAKLNILFRGLPVLHYVKSPEMAKLLLQYGADKTVKDKNGMTAYDYAVKYGYKDIADLLKPDEQNKQ